MQTTRKKLLVTLVLMTVAVASIWPTVTSARVSTMNVRGASDGYTNPVARTNATDTSGEPDQPGNGAPTPTIGITHMSVLPVRGGPHSRTMPMGQLLMWISRIWAAQYGVTP